MAAQVASGDGAGTLASKVGALELEKSREDVVFEQFKSELQLEAMSKLISKDLSEPYSIYTYRYFLNCWPDLSFLAIDQKTSEIIGCIICKIDTVNQSQFIEPTEYSSVEQQLQDTATKRGYIGMLAIDDRYRRLGIASKLVELSIDNMVANYGCQQVMLETEITNRKALSLYDKLGFVREERLYRYYLNGQDALRLILHLAASTKKGQQREQRRSLQSKDDAKTIKKAVLQIAPSLTSDMLLRRRHCASRTLFASILIILTSTFLYLTNFCRDNISPKDLELIISVRDEQLKSRNDENDRLKAKSLELEQKIQRLESQLEAAENFQGDHNGGRFAARTAEKSQSKSPHKLAVIVPFRDRFDELLIFVPHMTKFLTQQLGPNSFEIIIVNQADMFRFNRASLINVGYFLAKEHDCDYMVMHDVDLLPNNPEISYGYPNPSSDDSDGSFTKAVYHLSSPEYHPKYHYSKYIGGVLLMTTEVFELLNGLSNNYWGWGREDDELYTRMDRHKVTVRRQTGLTTGYDTYIHIHDDLDERRKRDYHRSESQKSAQWVADKTGGYQTTKYAVKSRQQLDFSTVDDNFNIGACILYNIEFDCDFEATPWCVTDDKMKRAVLMQREQRQRIENGGPVNWVYKGNTNVKVVQADNAN